MPVQKKLYKPKFSEADPRKQQAWIISKLVVGLFTSLRPSEYGAGHIGAALEKILILAAVRTCEGEGLSCTPAQIAKMLKIPRTNVQRALTQLSAVNVVSRIGHSYVAVPGRFDHDTKLKSLRDEVIAACRKLEPLAHHP